MNKAFGVEAKLVTSYQGMKAVYPNMVLVRGKAVVDDGQIVGKAGYGEYCTPQKAAK